MHIKITTWIMIMVLAACGTIEAPTDAPFYTATPHISQPLPRPELTQNPLSLPLGFADNSSENLTTQGNFSITVSGDVEASSSTGAIVYNYVPDSGSVVARDKIFITMHDDFATQQITLDFEPGLIPETYAITSPNNTIPQQVTAQYLRLSAEGDGRQTIPTQAYNQNVNGTFLILSRGATISGAFEFTADWVTGDEDGTTVTRSVTVSGDFTDVPYFRGDDPFENAVPLPERSTPAPLVGSD